MTSLKHGQQRRVVIIVILTATVTCACAPSIAAPNLVANGELDFQPEQATSRVSASGDTAIFEFPHEHNIGQVIAQGKNMGHQLASDIVVSFGAIGGASGRIGGLVVDCTNFKSGGGSGGNYDISIWFDLNGTIRPEREYAYSVVSLEAGGQSRSARPKVRMIAPAVWADGKLMGAEVELEWAPDDNTADSMAKRGVVRMPRFDRITGGQFLVLRLPQNFGGRFFLERVSLREIDEGLLTGKKTRMPTPTRYVKIEDPLERRIGEIIDTSKDALTRFLNRQNNWGSIRATALLLDALASLGQDMTTKEMRGAVRWLVEQEPETVPDVASRLLFVSHFASDEHRQTLAKDLLWLERAQFDDGGWATQTNDENEDRRIHSDNVNSLIASIALREAAYAGMETSRVMWRKSVGYWMEAQARDGGYRRGLDVYGGLGQAPTVSMTATGVTGMLISLDMAFAAGSSRCEQYHANRRQLAGIESGLDWLDKYYGEYYKTLASIDDEVPEPEKARASAYGMLSLIEVAGRGRFHNKDVFRAEAKSVLNYTNPATGLFLGGPSANAGEVLNVLLQAAAPTVVQRIVAGGGSEHEFSRDAYHLVRYMRRERKQALNWRATSIDTAIDRLALVPILYVNVVGKMDWKEKDWKKIRDYCFAGGSVLFNIAGQRDDLLPEVEQGLRTAFPEYRPKGLPADDAIFSIKHKIEGIDGVRVVSNGLKNFVYILPDDWSCPLNLYQTKDRADTFAFIDNLLAYTLDDEDPPRSFASSTWDMGAATVATVTAADLEVGSDLPAYPDRLRTIDRTMRSGYRLEVRKVDADSTSKPALLWLACTGNKPMTSAQKSVVRKCLKDGTYLFAEVVSGDPGWAEAFRSQLLGLDKRLRIRKMMSNHPILTGFIPETQGYDVREVPLRKALRKAYAKLPRADMHVIELDGVEVGALCTHDLSSGLGYVLYPGCRGVMPKQSREIATNIVLHAMDLATREQGDQHAASR